MMRALVLERRGRHAIVLLPGGEIRRVRAAHALVGDEILLPSHPPRVPVRRFAYAAAGLAVVLAVLPAALPLAQAKVVAYATVDINPSVELGLSAGGTVLTARPLDGDGHRILVTARVRGESLSGAIGTLLRTATAQGFISAARPAAVIVAGYSASQTAVPSAVQGQLRAARSLASGFLHRHGVQGMVSAMIVPQVLVQAAQKAHVSAGVYAVWSALHKAGAGVKVSAMRGGQLGSAMAKAAATSSGKAVLPLLTGTAKEPKAPQPVSSGHGPKSKNGPAPSGAGPAKSAGGAGQGSQAPQTGGPTLQVQVVTPAGTVQVQVGGDGQEGSGTTGPPAGGPGSVHGRGNLGKGGGHGDDNGTGHGRKDGGGQGFTPGGSSVAPTGSGQGTGGGGGRGPGSDQGNHGKGHHHKGAAKNGNGFPTPQGDGAGTSSSDVGGD